MEYTQPEDTEIFRKPKKELSFTKPIPNSLQSEIRKSGYCGACHNRYEDRPVIDGKVQCPTCNKI